MKIQKVIFSNLNSLRGTHTIPFDSGLLADVGIFAITGPTGAGKSTILDAITLAMFGRAARYAATPSPADIMSRGTAEASSEVHFQVTNGTVYRASWHLKRARLKADGKIQAAKRFIYDSEGVELAAGVRDCDSLIEQIIGLDADRFFRSAMLAQGEFAKFLRANDDERASLLESLTNTAVYSRISELAFTRFRDCEKALEAERAKLGAIDLLTEELIAAKNEEISVLNAKKTATDELLKPLRLKLDQLTRATSLASDIEQLLAKQANVNAQSQSMQLERELLQSHNSALLFLPELTEVKRLHKRFDHEQIQLQERQANHDGEQTRYANLIQNSLLVVSSKLERVDNSLETLRLQKESTEQNTREIRQWLNDRSDLDQLGNQFSEIQNLAAYVDTEALQLQSLVKSNAEILADCTSATKDCEDNSAEVKRIENSLAEQVKALDNLNQQFASQFFDLSVDQLNKEIDDDEALRLRLMEHGNLLRQLENLSTDQTDAQNKLQLITKQSEEFQRKASEHDNAVEILENLVASLRTNLQQATLIRSLDEHRSSLIAGEPCPLCGSLEHPFARETDFPDEDSTAKSLADAEAKLEAAESLQRDNQIKLASAANQCDDLQAQLATIVKKLGSLRQEQEFICAKIGVQCESLQAAKTLIMELAERIQLRKLSVADMTKKQREIATQQQLVDSLTAQKTEALHRGDLFKTALDKLYAKRNNNDVALRSSEAVLQQRRVAFVAALQPWKKHLEMFDLDSCSVKIVCEELLLQVSTYRNKLAELAKLEKSLRESVESEKEKSNIRCDWEKVRSVLTTSRESLPTAAFPDMDVCTEPSLENMTQDAHLTQHSTVREAWLNAATELNIQKKATEDAKSDWEKARSALIERLHSSPFTSLENLEGAILPDDRRAIIQQTFDELQKQVAEVATKLSLKQSELEQLQQVTSGEQSNLNDLQTTIAQLEQDVEALIRQQSGLQEQLRQDTENRLKQQAGYERLQDAIAKLETRRQLNVLIGSADGKKFRTYAQGLVLDYLVSHANVHLKRFSDRYRLLRSESGKLDLQICDLHQANAVRPMASLSGGESFLVSLSLALGLSELSGSNVQIHSLFIDEGFGTLDPDTLDIAISALESLRNNNKTIGVISHVELLKERIRAQIQVTKLHSGCSTLEIVNGSI